MLAIITQAGKTPRLSALKVVTLLAWAGTVLWFSVENLEDYLAPTWSFFRKIALGSLCFYSFAICGWRILGRRSAFLRIDPLITLVVELGTGIAVAMLLMFLAGIVGGVRAEVAWLIILGPLLGRHRPYLAAQRDRWGETPAGRPGRLCAVPLGLVAVMTLAESLAPAVSQDALVYHLAVPAKFVETGQIHFVEGNFYSAFPMNVEMLFTLGLLLDGESLAKWFHWLLGLASVMSVAALACELGSKGWIDRERRGVFLAAALFGTLPTVALISGWAYVDLGVVFYCTLSTLALALYIERRPDGADLGVTDSSRTFLYASAVFAGVAAGCKYTAAVQGLIVGAIVLVDDLRRGERRLAVISRFFVVGSLAFCCAAPWYVKNVVTTGNPVFPFAYGLFGGAGWDEEKAFVLSHSLGEWGGSRSGWSILSLPWDVSVSGRFFSQENFDGVIGGAFLIGLPFVILGLRLERSYRTVFFCSVVHALLWVGTTHQIRFLLPALALVSALLAISVSSLSDFRLRRWATASLGAVLLLNTLLVSVRFASQNPLSVVLGLETREDYMDRALPGGDYSVFRYIEDELPEDSRILFGSCGNPGFLCKRDYYSDAYFENTTLKNILEGLTTVDEVGNALQDRGFTHLLFRFDTVFDASGRKSELPVDAQLLLSRFLNDRARLEFQADLTMLWTLGAPEGWPGSVDQPADGFGELHREADRGEG